MNSEVIEKIVDLGVEYLTTIGVRLLGSVLLLLIGLRLIKIFVRFITKSKWFCKIETGAQTFIKSFLKITLKIILMITVAGILGVPMTSMVALIASGGIAIGFALQGALGNLAGGLMILIFKPFKVGDHIDTHADVGIVKEINIFYTVLKTFDSRIITLPNGTLTNTAIINFSMEKQRRVDFEFTVSYNSDIETVKEILIDIATKHELVINDPPVFARLKEHGDSALVFVLRAWCEAADYWTIYFDITESVKKEFDKADIEIPFPQMDVHIS